MPHDGSSSSDDDDDDDDDTKRVELLAPFVLVLEHRSARANDDCGEGILQ
jgi:hypothetical protein